jgi:factor associated with neutral sphingomyelinase activation
LRYPIFPWVIQDYTSNKLNLNDEKTFRDLSLPIGALNNKRLQNFKERFKQMEEFEEIKYLYGTHYSTPGI